MRLILTHEQSDFDALASLLGAYLLDEGALPVLPRRMNRNVRAFVTLYGVELPFVDPRDLPAETIESICLVDTQSMATLKGMEPDTRVHVVDHHPRRADLPPDWTITSEEVGATATLFVEQIREHGGGLSMIHATLLLLGIYEDSGSLTYSQTTARDLQAASHLLEQGANLSIAADFLNHPLSTQQQVLYDYLRASTESHEIHGYRIVIARGDAQELDEELSTIAHKLRDLLDPDALILLMTTRGGVQLIARSTSDNIDVAEIAAYFGGGGHSRAAASLIKAGELSDIYAELLRVLPDYVHPAITVSEIMSRSPQLLSPNTPVAEVAERMQRFGYEGYPVVQQGRIVGLVTRRAVDRALAHKLNLTASSLMDAGEVTVAPHDSIEQLQRLMTDTGWGQIPVVNPQSGDIVGIVTRTDLLKTLTPQPGLPGYQNLSERLEKALPPARLALLKAVAEVARQERTALFIVGGFVRDLLLERPSLDYDLVVEGDAITLARVLQKRYGGRLTSHSRFGTAKWLIAGIRDQLAKALAHPGNAADLPNFLDLITARTEFYSHPTALPTVERGSIKLDLHRRDFTFNTLALRLDGHHYGELHDYWGGLNDLRDGRVRVLHSLSFVDDPTRMLRAVRFEQRFGFQIEERTLELLREALPLLGRVSGDRIRHEMDHILDEANRVCMLDRLVELGLLEAIHPALRWDAWTRQHFEAIEAEELPSNWRVPQNVSRTPLKRALAYTFLLMRMPQDKVRAIIVRLKCTRALVDDILAACRLWRDLSQLAGAAPSLVVSMLEDVPPLALYANYLATPDPELRSVLDAYITRWRKVTSRIDGHDLRARGLPPGPVYRQILRALRNAWLDGEIRSAQEEQLLLGRLLAEQDIIEDEPG